MQSVSQNGSICSQTIQLPFTSLKLNRPLKVLLKSKDVMAYKNTLIRHNKYMNQLNYMMRTISNGCIPKGIQDQAKFRVSFEEANIQATCQGLFHYAASRSADVIRRHLKVTVETLRQRVFRLDTVLKSSLTHHELAAVMEEMNKQVNKLNEEQ